MIGSYAIQVEDLSVEMNFTLRNVKSEVPVQHHIEISSGQMNYFYLVI